MNADQSVISTYSLRIWWGKLAVLPPRNSSLKNSFSYSDAALWNGESTNLRQAQLNLAAGVSFLIMNKLYLITHHLWKAVIFLLLF